MGTTSEEAPRRARGADRSVETFALVLLGGAAGLLVLLLPEDWRPLGSSTLFSAALIANSTVVITQWRRQGRTRADDGDGAQPGTAVPLLHRPWVRRTYLVAAGVLLSQLSLRADSPVTRAAVLLLGVVVVVSFTPLVRRFHRRQLAAARAEHAGRAVVLVALVDLATMRLAQWAKAARETLPAEVGRAGVLVADTEGLALHRAGRPARLVHRWAWDDVELSCAPHPEDHEAAALVLTLLGPTPAPRHRETPVRRRRFDVTLSVRDGAEPASAAVVERVITDLTAPRPTASRGSSVAGLGDVR